MCFTFLKALSGDCLGLFVIFSRRFKQIQGLENGALHKFNLQSGMHRGTIPKVAEGQQDPDSFGVKAGGASCREKRVSRARPFGNALQGFLRPVLHRRMNTNFIQILPGSIWHVCCHLLGLHKTAAKPSHILKHAHPKSHEISNAQPFLHRRFPNALARRKLHHHHLWLIWVAFVG